jgi:hypothetical protein
MVCLILLHELVPFLGAFPLRTRLCPFRNPAQMEIVFFFKFPNQNKYLEHLTPNCVNYQRQLSIFTSLSQKPLLDYLNLVRQFLQFQRKPKIEPVVMILLV